MRKLIILGIVVIVVFLLAGCESESERSEVGTRQGNYDKLIEMEPALEVTNPKTRETVHYYTETWHEEGQPAYVNRQNNEGNRRGHYAQDGAPVSAGTAATPADRVDGA